MVWLMRTLFQESDCDPPSSLRRGASWLGCITRVTLGLALGSLLRLMMNTFVLHVSMRERKRFRHARRRSCAAVGFDLLLVMPGCLWRLPHVFRVHPPPPTQAPDSVCDHQLAGFS